MLKTYVWRIQPDGQRVRQNVVRIGSKFRSLPHSAAELKTPEGQARVANELVRRWKETGPFPAGTKWEVEVLAGAA